MSPNVRWVVESTGIVLIDEQTGEIQKLGYPEEALWDMIQRQYHFARIVELLSVIMLEDKKTTEASAIRIIHRWRRQGYLQRGKTG